MRLEKIMEALSRRFNFLSEQRVSKISFFNFFFDELMYFCVNRHFYNVHAINQLSRLLFQLWAIVNKKLLNLSPDYNASHTITAQEHFLFCVLKIQDLLLL